MKYVVKKIIEKHNKSIKSIDFFLSFKYVIYVVFYSDLDSSWWRHFGKLHIWKSCYAKSIQWKFIKRRHTTRFSDIICFALLYFPLFWHFQNKRDVIFAPMTLNEHMIYWVIAFGLIFRTVDTLYVRYMSNFKGMSFR